MSINSNTILGITYRNPSNFTEEGDKNYVKKSS